MRTVGTSGEVWFPSGPGGRGVTSRSKSSQSVLVEADDMDPHFVGCSRGGHADDAPARSGDGD